MTKRNVALEQAREKIYESHRHEAVAISMARGDIPPESEWTWQQQAAVTAYLDGCADPHVRHLVKVTDCGNGHREALICRKWVDPWKAMCRLYFGDKSARGEGDREASIERAARRANAKVRQLVKSLGCDSLGTLTYRDNVTDRDTVLKHWREFVRRVRKVLPSFHYVATLEKQKRGAYHVHVAMQRLPARLRVDGHTLKSWDVMRAIWRRVIGGSGGNFDESKRQNGALAQCMRIARYIGKYVAKDFADGDLNSRRYMPSAIVQPTVTRSWHDQADMAGLIASVYADISADMVDASTWLTPYGDLLWLSVYAPPEGPPRPRLSGC